MKTLLSLLFASALTSCASQMVQTELVYSTSQCRQQTAAVRILKDAQDMAATTGLPMTIGHDGQTPQLLQNFDFERYLAVLVGAGRQPNAGYSIVLSASTAKVKRQTVELPVQFVLPDPRKVYLQVVTTPCIVVGVEKSDFSKVRAGTLETTLE